MFLMRKQSELRRFGVSIPKELLDQFDLLVEAKGYMGRSEAIRDAIRLIISQWDLERSQEGGAATLSVVYRHKAKLMAELTNAQHGSNTNVISTLHVHLTPSHCLEVLTVRGERKSIQKFADKIGGLSGVEFARLFMFSVPESYEHNHSH